MTSKTPVFSGWAPLPDALPKVPASASLKSDCGWRVRDFPAWRRCLRDGSIPLLARAQSGTGSSRRVYDTDTTFHAYLWQVLDGLAACREAVLLLVHGPVVHPRRPRAAHFMRAAGRRDDSCRVGLRHDLVVHPRCSCTAHFVGAAGRLGRGIVAR
jgi:hypothetical protein